MGMLLFAGAVFDCLLVSSLLWGRGSFMLYLLCFFPKSMTRNAGGGGTDGSLGFSYPFSSRFVNVFTFWFCYGFLAVAIIVKA